MFIDHLQRGLYTFLHEEGELSGAAEIQSIVCIVTNGLLGGCDSNFLEIIHKLLPCSSGLIAHFSYDHPNLLRQNLIRILRPGVIVFENFFHLRINCTTKLSPCQPSCRPFWPCAGLQSCPVWPDSSLVLPLVRTGVFYT